MTKEQFKQHWMAMYRVGIRSDADEHEEWTKPVMASHGCCRLLDQMAHELVNAGIWTVEEHQEMLDTL
jgi:hypothetical protein